MRLILKYFLIGLSFTFAFPVCRNQEARAGKVRQPSKAGQFYPASKDILSNMIRNFLDNADKIDIDGEIIGLWTPHAGYEFSGQIAANAYKLVAEKEFETIILIGPSHYVHLNGGSIGDWDRYRTPLGEVAVDTQIVNNIRSLTSLISCVPAAHRHEHSVEVQIPFIQTVLPGIPIVPIVVGSLSYESSKEIASSIVKAVKGKKVLIVASSDMSHFPNYNDAYEVDTQVLKAVDAFDPKKILRLNHSLPRKDIQGLDCALCGPSALITVMLVSEKLKAKEVKVLPYANSGDVSGERYRVVGYGAAVFYKKSKKIINEGGEALEDINFSKEEKDRLFKIARESILSALKKEKIPEFSVDEQNLLVKRGVFVTLTNKGRLRGCIGHFAQDYPLYKIVSQMALAAATEDYRFMYNPVTLQEMDDINIKISVLSGLKKIDSIEEIEIGKHGIWIKQGNRSGTYLPEVATDLGWNREEFLEHCCAEKAGLSHDAWKKGADIFIYTSQIIDEKDLK